MKRVVALWTLSALMIGHAAAATAAPAATSDEAAIRAIIAADDDGRPDAHFAARLDWENAFGVRYTDAANRERLLHYVATKLQAHAKSEVLETRITFPDPAFAVADEYWHVVGQIDQATGKPGADRWGRTTYVLRKESGNWSLVVERIADLRIPYYKHYSALPKPVTVPPAILASYAGNYVTSTGKADSRITVEGDHLLVDAGGSKGIGIATSAQDFVVFTPGDLERYYDLHFEPGGTKLAWSADRGQRSGTAVKATAALPAGQHRNGHS
jgi:ketosteroid isomerase-like protein